MTVPDNDPQFTVEMAEVDLRNSVNRMMTLRSDPRTAEHVAHIEGYLLASLATLQSLCRELRDARARHVMQAAE